MIAGECGFGNVNSMRNVFQRTLKIAPGQYRRHFRHVKHPARKSNQESGKRRNKVDRLVFQGDAEPEATCRAAYAQGYGAPWDHAFFI